MKTYRVDHFNFRSLFCSIQRDLIGEPSVAIGEWQSQKLDDSMKMRELHNVAFTMDLPSSQVILADITGAHLPWAEDHFRERVSGEPMNPAPSEAWWPFARKQNTEHKSEDGQKFSHTYPERMWPKFAEVAEVLVNDGGPGYQMWGPERINQGIRFDYGDLSDVINQLATSLHTRQAYLPIWFPEDTGSVHGKRVPCTLGYQFTVRDDRLSITYFMRSTDLLRHFQDDIYMAGRLAQWVADQLADKLNRDISVSTLTFHTVNMHVFEADVPMMKLRDERGESWPIV